jgi:hypothetical protein
MLSVNPGDHDRFKGYLQMMAPEAENRQSSGKGHNNVGDANDCSACEERGRWGRIGHRSEFSAILIQRESRRSEAA